MRLKRTSTRGGTVGKAMRYAETPSLEVLYTEHERQARGRSQQAGRYSTSFSMTSVGPLAPVARHISFSSPQVPTLVLAVTRQDGIWTPGGSTVCDLGFDLTSSFLFAHCDSADAVPLQRTTSEYQSQVDTAKIDNRCQFSVPRDTHQYT